MHRRALVRDHIVTTITGLPTTGAAVTVGRVNPDTVLALPSLNVVTGAEEILDDEQILGALTGPPWPQTRSLEIGIEIRVSGADGDLDAAIDAIALEVEQAMGVDMGGSGAAHKITYIGSDASELTGDLEAPVGLRVMTYQATYRVDARDPQSLED